MNIDEVTAIWFDNNDLRTPKINRLHRVVLGFESTGHQLTCNTMMFWCSSCSSCASIWINKIWTFLCLCHSCWPPSWRVASESHDFEQARLLWSLPGSDFRPKFLTWSPKRTNTTKSVAAVDKPSDGGFSLKQMRGAALSLWFDGHLVTFVECVA